MIASSSAYKNQTNDSRFRDCDLNGGVDRDVIGKTDTVKSCRFNLSSLGECSNLVEGTNYGYADGKPCILVKVNRVSYISVLCDYRAEDERRVLQFTTWPSMLYEVSSHLG